MSKLTEKITQAIVILADLKIEVDLLERDLKLAQEQNLDLRRRLKKLQPVGRSE